MKTYYISGHLLSEHIFIDNTNISFFKTFYKSGKLYYCCCYLNYLNNSKYNQPRYYLEFYKNKFRINI